jgi:ABC-type branched-subunit amino acid transport system substrate-binding protein
VKASTIAAVVALVAGACSSTPAGSAAASGSVAPSTSAAASGSAAPSGSAAAGGTINVGGGFALTGIEASLDVPAANGAKLAVKEINGASGVLGKQINLIIHDSQYKADITTQNAKQFVEQDKVPLMIGYTDSDSVLQTGPTMQKAKVPFITVGATSPRLPTQIGDMMFLACFGDNVQAAVGAEYSFDKFGKNASTSSRASRSSAASSCSKTPTMTLRRTSRRRSRRSRRSRPSPTSTTSRPCRTTSARS